MSSHSVPTKWPPHIFLPLPLFELLFVALGVLLLWPREFDVESGTSSEGSSHPWHDFFELESGKMVPYLHFIDHFFPHIFHNVNLLHCWLSSSPLRLSLFSSSSDFDKVCLLCFIRRFWNQTFTWNSKRIRLKSPHSTSMCDNCSTVGLNKRSWTWGFPIQNYKWIR